MPNIAASMDDLAKRVQLLTDRPVTSDPRNASVTPCVIVGTPSLDYTTQTMCGTVTARFPLVVVGLSGARAELTPLSELLGEVLAGDLAVVTAEPFWYEPLNNSGTADPSMAYRVTVEELI